MIEICVRKRRTTAYDANRGVGTAIQLRQPPLPANEVEYVFFAIAKVQKKMKKKTKKRNDHHLNFISALCDRPIHT